MSRRSFTSSTFTFPLKTNVPSPSSTTVSLSTSYSSRISPTISSSRSSTVTSPAVPPYSSTTIASCALRVSRGRCVRRLRRRLVSVVLAVATHVDDVHQRDRDRSRQPRQRRERRQKDVEHGFGIVSRDDGRDQMLADDHEQRERDHE